MLVPRIVSLEALGYALHECAHFWLRHFSLEEAQNVQQRYAFTGNVKPTLAEQEYEAERWTQGIMLLHGLPVTRELRYDQRNYVSECLDSDTLKNKTPSHIKKWSTR